MHPTRCSLLIQASEPPRYTLISYGFHRPEIGSRLSLTRGPLRGIVGTHHPATGTLSLHEGPRDEWKPRSRAALL